MATRRASGGALRGRALAGALELAFFCVLGGCQENRGKEELERLSFLLDRVSEQTPEERGALLEELGALRCERFCELRDECARGYRKQKEALEGLARLARELDQKEGQRPSDEQLDTLEREIDDAQVIIEGCIARRFELQRAHGL